MQFAIINGMSIHYRHVRSGSGRPVLAFSNSLGTDFRIWDDVAEDLSRDHDLVLYDKRGHGLSDAGTAPYVIDDHVADLDGLLAHLGVSRAVVVGLSVGGLIAQGLYARNARLLRGLVLCDTAHRIGTDEMWNARIEGVRTGGIESLANGIMERWFTPGFRDPANPAFRAYRNMLVRTTAAGYAGTSAAIRDTDFTEVASSIAVPTLCVVGEQDGATPPALVQTLSGLIPGSRYEVIRDAGHLPCIEQPGMFTAVLRDFLSALPA
jgi:3-oxoadipate enol-lactonase